ncbi:MAG: hypothetical protein LBI01_02085, partial [Elusimicrobium sp.]|nr:hypothetical protein [Elusimicrobium sp.]
MIKNLTLIAVLFLVAGTSAASDMKEYESCRCTLKAPGLSDNDGTCCPVSVYRGNFPNNCCQNSNGAWIAKSSGNCKGTTCALGAWTASASNGTTTCGATPAAGCVQYTACGANGAPACADSSNINAR